VKVSIVIPSFNRRRILAKSLAALWRQTIPAGSPIDDYEVVVVDDGSTDGTAELATGHEAAAGRLRLLRQTRSGPAAARNAGVAAARFETICFIDSDLVPVPGFLHAHGEALAEASARDPRCFTSGPVVDTTRFDDPESEPRKVTDYSRAFFATGNVMLARRWLDEAGGFDQDFGVYGWEDLELGVRLRRLGVRLVRAPGAVGYHWHPAFSFAEWPALLAREDERARSALVFLRKHPTPAVKLMIQRTWPQRVLWEVLTGAGAFDAVVYRPLARWLVAAGRPHLALAVARVMLNRHYVRAVYGAGRRLPPTTAGR
jgi:glycosyltransferase involved in cell wall biosynthesis